MKHFHFFLIFVLFFSNVNKIFTKTLISVRFFQKNTQNINKRTIAFHPQSSDMW